MKKILLSFILVLATSFLSAQENVNADTLAVEQNTTKIKVPSGYQGFFEQGTHFQVAEKGKAMINFSTTHGAYLNGKIFVGMGLGVDFQMDLAIVPIYGAFRYVFINDKLVSPVLGLRVGSYISSHIGAYVDACAGVRFATKRDFAVNVMLAGTYYSTLERERWIDGVYDSETGEVIESGYYETYKYQPSGISLRIGIEW